MRLLVVSPHPDDETLGAGGMLLRYKDEGNKIYWLNFTNMRKEYGYSDSDVKKRDDEIEKVGKVYQFDRFFDLGLKPASLDMYGMNELIGRVSGVINKIKPDAIYLPYKNDIHSDHRVAFEASYACTKIFRYPFIKKICMMEIFSETDFAASDNGFVPNYFIDISGFLKKKIEIMNIYHNETGMHPFPRSSEGIASLAVCRGSAAGCKHAEGFIMLKGIE